MEAPHINERRWLAVIFSTYLFLSVGYSLLMPIWEAPDEPAHYHMAWFFARFGHFPPLTQNYEENQPKPYYYLASWVIRGLDHVDPRLSDYSTPRVSPMEIRCVGRPSRPPLRRAGRDRRTEPSDPGDTTHRRTGQTYAADRSDGRRKKPCEGSAYQMHDTPRGMLGFFSQGAESSRCRCKSRTLRS